MTKKKEDSMQTQTTTTIPLPPSPEKKRPIQGEINSELWTAVERERKSRKITKRKIIEFGLVAFLQQANPAAAAPFIRKLEIKS